MRPSMKDLVKISAPQDLDGDVFEDDYEGPRDVSWNIFDNTFLSFPSYPSLLE